MSEIYSLAKNWAVIAYTATLASKQNEVLKAASEDVGGKSSIVSKADAKS